MKDKFEAVREISAMTVTMDETANLKDAVAEAVGGNAGKVEIIDGDGEFCAVVLSREEYYNLCAVAEFAQDPERLLLMMNAKERLELLTRVQDRENAASEAAKFRIPYIRQP